MYNIFLIPFLTVCLAISTNDIYKNSYALVIGIDKYKNNSLDYAVKDAESISDLLNKKYNFKSKNISILLDEKATLSNIKNSLSKIAIKAGKNDRVLIYFAGHGITEDLPDGGEMGYLLPIDGEVDNLFATSIPMDDLRRISSISKSKHMLFLVDACYGGLSAVGARGLNADITPNYINKITNDKSRQIITAGGRGEKVIEKSEWGHSAFTMNLIRALDDAKADLNLDGFITADELGLYLKEKVTIDSQNQQTPQIRRFTSQEGEFVFINNMLIENQTIQNINSDDNNFLPIDYDSLASIMAGKITSIDLLKQSKDMLSDNFPILFFSPNLSSLRGNEIIDQYHKSRIGFSGGVNYNYNFYKNIFFTYGIYFERKGSQPIVENQIAMDEFGNIEKMNSGNATLYDMIFDYITVPLTLKVYLDKKMNYFIENGLYYSYLINHIQKSGATIYEDLSIKENDYGIVVGLGRNIILSKNTILIIQIKNNFGLQNISKVQVINNGSIKHNSLGLLFSIGLPSL